MTKITTRQLKAALDREKPFVELKRLRPLCKEQARDIVMLTREADTARAQMRQTVQVNHHNAAAHRATEVAMLLQNHQLQAAEARLSGKVPHPELTAGGKIHVSLPERIPVPEPKTIQP